jgi:hypothetical protein
VTGQPPAPAEDVTAFLDRCDDVLTHWYGSKDAVHYVGGVPVDPAESDSIGFERSRRAMRARLGHLIETAQVQLLIEEQARRCDATAEGAELTGIVLDDTHHVLCPDPRERALRLRRERNTGPQLHRLDGRRR